MICNFQINKFVVPSFKNILQTSNKNYCSILIMRGKASLNEAQSVMFVVKLFCKKRARSLGSCAAEGRSATPLIPTPLMHFSMF